MKKIILFALVLTFTSTVFAQSTITAQVTTTDSKKSAEGIVKFTNGLIADSVLKTDSTVILVFKKFPMRVEMSKESYIGYLDFLINSKEKQLIKQGNTTYGGNYVPGVWPGSSTITTYPKQYSQPYPVPVEPKIRKQ